MIRNIFMALLLTTSLLQAEPSADEAGLSPIELLLFKIGYTALIDDFEQEKNTTAANTKRIEALEKNFQLLVNFMELTKKELVQNGELTPEAAARYGIYDSSAMKKELTEILQRFRQNVETEQQGELAKLRREVALLKEQVKNVQHPSGAKTTAPISRPAPIAVPAVDTQRFTPKNGSINIRTAPSVSAPEAGSLNPGESVRFESCDDFGWCKLDGVQGYVARYLLIPAPAAQ